jgi:hypothetical protein
LSVIPNTDSNRFSVVINDYVQMRKQFQINALYTDATDDEQIAYIQNLISMGRNGDMTGRLLAPGAQIGFISGYAYLQLGIGLLRNLGLGYWMIDQEAQAGWPPINFSIVKGTFDPEKTRQALAVSAKNDPPTIETYLENEIYSWGKEDYALDLTKVLAPPVYDNLGRGGRFVFQDNYAFRANGMPEIKLVLDAQNGRQTSLADNKDYKLLAQELSSQNAMCAMLSTNTQTISSVKDSLYSYWSGKPEDLDKYLAQGPKLLPYQTMALGLSKDEKGLYAIIVLVHADNETAAKNESLLKQRIEETNSILYSKKWTTFFSSSSITSRGRVLMAKLYGDNVCRMWIQWYYQNDPLILHE